jgi:plastocyanin
LLSILVALGATLLGGGVASAAGHTVRITFTLDPATITIAPGDRITWRNDDDERHRIRSLSGPREFDSGNLEPGETFGITLRAAGRYEYYDHRDDEATAYYGTVIVAEAGQSGPGDAGEPADAGEPTAEAPAQATVAIGDRVFRPGNVTIAAGGSVTWRNDDDRPHTATGIGGEFDTGTLAPGESARASFPQAGTYPFLCLIHPDMRGTVTVTASGGGAPNEPEPIPRATPTSAPGDPGTASPAPSTGSQATAEPGADSSPVGVDGGAFAGGGNGQAGSAGGGGGIAPAAEPVAASRQIGAALIGVAVAGALLLAVGVGGASLRGHPESARPRREVREATH